MRGRFYSPAWHRFINSDQGVDPNSWNQFAYVGGSPFQKRDPSGMEANATVEVIGDDPGPMYQIDWSWIFHWGAISGVSTGSTGGNTGSNVSGQKVKAVVPRLSKEKCAALKMMLAGEKKYGTTGMSITQAFIIPTNRAYRAMGFKQFGNSVLFQSPNGLTPTYTKYGEMDLSWFITLNAAASTRSLGAAAGWWGKQADNFSSLFALDTNWETPFVTDPGEALAFDAYLAGKSLSDLFPPELLSELCPD